MDGYLVFAKDLARQGGQLIRENFEKNLKIEIKPDNSPVTQVDHAINELISQKIKAAYPEHGLLGEEADHGTGEEEFQWVCDPLDGTKAFVIGAPMSTCILGLTKAGQMLVSVVYNPYTDRLYHAVKDEGAFCNDQSISVSQRSLAESGYVLLSESSFHFAKSIEAAGGRVEPMAGAGYRSMFIATGRCLATIQVKADFHDVGPASLIVEEAGGKVTDLNGETIIFNQPLSKGIILSNGAAHNELVNITKNSLSGMST